MAKRNQYFATIVYPESALKEWIDILRELHIMALISPLHDKDTDSEGNPKKPHYHVILLFESLKSEEQAQDMADRFGGVKVIPIHSLGAYSRYLCHLDDASKAQYSTEDVTEISGADYKESCRMNSTNQYEKCIVELTAMILDNNIIYFHELAKKALAEDKDLFAAVVKYAYYLRAVIMSLAIENERKEKKNLCL